VGLGSLLEKVSIPILTLENFEKVNLLNFLLLEDDSDEPLEK
jgi:hypothetical protein